MSKPPGGLPKASTLLAEADTASREIVIARIATELRCRTATLQESVRSGSVFLTRAFQCRQQACSETDNGNTRGNWWGGGPSGTLCQQKRGRAEDRNGRSATHI